MKVLLIGSFPDRVNSNTILRRCAAEGFRSLAEVDLAVDACPEQHAREICAAQWDLVVFMGSILLDWFDLYSIIDAARENLTPGGKLALWLHDDPYEFDASHRYDGMFDRVYTTDPTAQLYYRRQESTRWLPLAASPVLHFRAPAVPVRAWDFFFCGEAFENRVALLRQIEAAGFRGRIFGSGWPGHLYSAVNSRLGASDLCDYYNAAPITLVLGRNLDLRNNLFRLRQAIFGPRVYEAAMAGAAQLVWDADCQLFGEFQSGSHLLAVRNEGELREGMQLLLSDSDANLALRRNAVDHAMASHTYAHRAERMVADLWP
ncbi:MAG: glycosyltransferase [Paracoccaceae bacterium]|nr:glycosyltransferase [Paracoccaceae bacterium]